MDNGIILALLQQANGALHPASMEIAAAACDLAAQSGQKSAGVLLAESWDEAFENQVKACGLQTVYVYANARFGSFIAEDQAKALISCVQQLKPDILLAGATPEGRALAAMAAAMLKTGVTADCTALSFREDGLLVQTRPAFGGSVMAQIITPAARPQIATLRYGGTKTAKASATEIILKTVQDEVETQSGVHAEWVDRLSPKSNAERIVIAVGGGLASKEDLALFERLAESCGAALMGSRALVERGWLPRSHQIGLSGQHIEADLLITFGISGSVQFMAGVQGAKRLCAVTIDENAPIMKAADIPVAGDMLAVAAEMLSQED